MYIYVYISNRQVGEGEGLDELDGPGSKSDLATPPDAIHTYLLSRLT